MKRLSWVLPFFAFFTLVSSQAQAAPQTPQAVVADTTEQIMQVLRDGQDGNDDHATFGALERVVMPHVDLARISHRLLGDHWLSATAEQKNRFAGQFRKLLVKTYVAVLRQYTHARIAYFPGHGDSGANIATVKSEVTATGSPVAIDYRLQRQDGEWKLFDVALNGVSLLASYRSSFNRWVNTMGIDGLTDALAARNQ